MRCCWPTLCNPCQQPSQALALSSAPRPLALTPHAAAALMADVYADHKDEDNFLYITYRWVP